MDRYTDVFYLAVTTSAFPYISDYAENWSGGAHPFIILPVNGVEQFVVDTPTGPEIALPDEQVVHTELVVQAVIEALKSSGLDRGRVGLVGADVLPIRTYGILCDALRKAEWVSAQTRLNHIVNLYS